MNQDKKESSQQYYEDDRVDLIDLLLVIARRKKFIIKTTLTFALIAIIYSLTATKIYKAETKLISPQGNSGEALTVLAQTGIPDFTRRMLGIKTPGDLLVAIAKSEPVLDQVIDQLDLMDRKTAKNPIAEMISAKIGEATSYMRTEILMQQAAKKTDSPTRSEVQRSLSNATTATSDIKSGIITISVLDTSPDLAARIANAYTDSLQDMMQKLSLNQASRQRLFFEQQVKEEQLDLLKAEQNLSDYQRETGILNVGMQTTTVMERLARLRGQKTAKEIELQATSKFVTKSNPRVMAIEAELASINKQLRHMKISTGHTIPSEISLKDLPDAGLNYLRLMRDLKFHETLYGMLIKQYESSRIAEAQEVNVIQVISAAKTPEKREKPNRKLLVVMATVAGFFISIFGAFIKEGFANAEKDPERAEKVKELKWRMSLFKRDTK